MDKLSSGSKSLSAKRAEAISAWEPANTAMGKLLMYARFPQTACLSYQEVSAALDALVTFALAFEDILELSRPDSAS